MPSAAELSTPEAAAWGTSPPRPPPSPRQGHGDPQKTLGGGQGDGKETRGEKLPIPCSISAPPFLPSGDLRAPNLCEPPPKYKNLAAAALGEESEGKGKGELGWGLSRSPPRLTSLP